MKSSKAQIQAKFYKIPTIRFEDQRLTFLKLEEDPEYIDEIKDQVKKNLLIKKGESSNSS